MATDYLLMGMKCLNVTQIGSAYDGKYHYSHSSYEIDLAGMDTGKDVWRNMMPNTKWYCAGKWGNQSTGNTYFFWSRDEKGNNKQVMCADGVLRFITLALTHANQNFSIGHYYGYQEVMYQEGTSGYATGNHIHMEICAGQVKSKVKNSKGFYVLPNMLPANKIMYLLNGYTYIKNAGGLNWKTTNTTSPVVPKTNTSTSENTTTGFAKAYAKGKKLKAKVNLNLRISPSTSAKVVTVAKKGTVLYWYGYYAHTKKDGKTVVWYKVTDGKNEGYAYGGVFNSGSAPYLEGVNP